MNISLMNGLSELIDSLEVKFFKLNQKVIQLENKNKELFAALSVYQDNEYKQLLEIESLKNQIDTLKVVNSLLGSDNQRY